MPSFVSRMILLSVIMSLFYSTVFSQPDYKDSIFSGTANFYNIVSEFNNWLDTTSISDSLKFRAEKKFSRFYNFWINRVGSTDSSFDGKFSAFADAYGSWWQNPPCQSNDEANWKPIGPFPGDEYLDMGIISAIWTDDSYTNLNNKLILVGSGRAGGIWKSTDFGATWYDVTYDSQGIRLPATGIQNIQQSKENNNIFYASTGSTHTGFSIGIIKSTDNGETWNPITTFPPYQQSDFNYRVIKIIVTNVNGQDLIYAITEKKFYKSVNGGQSWIISGLPLTNDDVMFTDMEIDPNNNDIIAISACGSDNKNIRARIWISQSGGTVTTWTEILQNLPSSYQNYLQGANLINAIIDFPSLTVNDSRLYVLTSLQNPTKTKTVFWTDDLGTTWNPVEKWDPTTQQYVPMNFFPTQGLVGVGNQMNDFHVSSDYYDIFAASEYLQKAHLNPNGNHTMEYLFYYTTQKNTHADIRCILIHDDHILAGTDGGLTWGVLDQTSNYTWNSLNGYGTSGINNNEVLGFNFFNGYGKNIAIGLMDNSFKFFKDNWISCDFPLSHEEQNDPGVIHTTMKTGVGDGGNCYIKENNTSAFYIIGSDALFKISYQNPGFHALHYNSVNCYDPGPIKVSETPSGNDIIYIGYYNGEINKSVDGGTTFTTIPLEQGHPSKVTKIKIAPSDPNIMYAVTEYAGHGTLPSFRRSVYRSSDAGNTWVDITGHNGNFPINNQYVHVSDLTIDWNNPNRIWIGMAGIGEYNGSSVVRVFKTDDASQGNSTEWIDMTTNTLTPLPVIAITSHPGSERVFIATDIGIFYWDITISDWVCFFENLPYSHITDLKFDPKTSELYLATFGHGIWKTSVPCIPSLSSITEINTGIESWTGIKHINGDIIIRSGNSLIINDEAIVYMNDGDKIIVEPNAQLIVDNATITTACDVMWQGIELQGNASQNQVPANKGMAILKNGATIANAKTGISTQYPVAIGQMEGTGGIIRATDANFYDCEYVIKMYPYQNFHPVSLKPRPEASYINGCNFVTFDELKEPGVTTQSFIYLDGIHHINIKGNTFENKDDDNPATGKGIESFNSVFNVVENCTGTSTPCNAWETNKFKNLSYGIHAMATQANIPLTINKAEFTNNMRGVYLSGINAAMVTYNDFTLTDIPLTGLSNYGLYLDNCTEYIIEENTFEKNGSGLEPNVGMVVNNSGSDPNQVYNNYFNDLQHGILAQHDNRGNTDKTGLKIKCNDFEGLLSYDIGVTKSIGYVGTTGISDYQGGNVSESSPAGNTFSWSGYNIYSDMNNNGLMISKYYHHDIAGATPQAGENWVPKYFTDFNISLNNTFFIYDEKNNVCPTNPVVGSTTMTQLYTQVSQQKANINSAQLILDIWKDGGMENLPEVVELAYPWETYEMYNTLMQGSPYLSDETMIEAINNTSLLPDNLLKLVLIANPHCTRSEEVMLALEERIPPLPQAMVDEIMLGYEAPSPLEDLEADVSYYIQLRKNAINLIKRGYLTDTINDYNSDSLQDLLGREEFIDAQYQRAFILLANEDYEGFGQLVSSLAIAHDGTEYRTAQYQEFDTYFDIIQDMQQNDLSYNDLTSQQQTDLELLATTGSFFPAAWARGILLRESGEFTYEEPIAYPEVVLQRIARPATPETQPEKLKVYPNPATSYVIAEYNAGSAGSIVIRVTDNTGKEIMSKQVETVSGTEVFSCTSWQTGTYFVSLVVNNEIIETKKLSITQ